MRSQNTKSKTSYECTSEVHGKLECKDTLFLVKMLKPMHNFFHNIHFHELFKYPLCMWISNFYTNIDLSFNFIFTDLLKFPPYWTICLLKVLPSHRWATLRSLSLLQLSVSSHLPGCLSPLFTPLLLSLLLPFDSPGNFPVYLTQNLSIPLCCRPQFMDFSPPKWSVKVFHKKKKKKVFLDEFLFFCQLWN